MGRPSLELLESLACISKPADPKFSLAWDGNVTELDDMTCSLLESSLINSVYSADTSASDLTSQLSIVNKKQKVTSHLERRRGSLVISDKSDEVVSEELDEIPKHDNGNILTNHIENVNYSSLKVSTSQNDVSTVMDMDSPLLESTDFSTSLIDSTLLNANLMDTVIINTKSNLCASKVHQINLTFTPSPQPINSARKVLGINQSSNENLNHTFVKNEDSPMTCPLNDTFSVESNGSSGGQRSVPLLVRPGSTDSGGADDDQLSSTSESSHTSATRLMSVGDVQNIARLQEQSLVISTPADRDLAMAKAFDCCNGISPIPRGKGLVDCGRSSGSSEVQTGGYLSDHSSRSPLSSLHSSPAGSPFGSSTMLPGPNQTQTHDTRFSYRPNGMLQRKNTYGLIPPGKAKERGIQPPAATFANATRPTVRSGLRPPMIRTAAAGSAGLPRPAGTGIPRPSSLSRIPPPKVRSSVPRPSRKEWTDECY